jgi:Radial spokehead-like protein
MQQGTVGGNKYTYWVQHSSAAAAAAAAVNTNGSSSSSSSGWTQLPPVTQAQIAGARKIRRLLIGDLSAPVQGYPPFPGTERNLLRAQVSLVTSNSLAVVIIYRAMVVGGTGYSIGSSSGRNSSKLLSQWCYC